MSSHGSLRPAAGPLRPVAAHAFHNWRLRSAQISTARTLTPPNAIPKFAFNDHELRGVIIDGQPWFVAADVCRVLGIHVKDNGKVNVTPAVQKLEEDEKGSYKIGTLGGAQHMMCVSRPGLFKLIQRSNKPEAKAFDRWVRHDVLPQIMDAGGYVTADANVEKVLEAAPRQPQPSTACRSALRSSAVTTTFCARPRSSFWSRTATPSPMSSAWPSCRVIVSLLFVILIAPV